MALVQKNGNQDADRAGYSITTSAKWAGNQPGVRSWADAVVLIDQNGNPVGAGGAAYSNMTPAQVSVAATATQIVAARAGRGSVTIQNTTTTPVYIGSTNAVTTTTGILLPGTVGATITLPYSGAVYGIVGTGSATVTEYELY